MGLIVRGYFKPVGKALWMDLELPGHLHSLSINLLIDERFFLENFPAVQADLQVPRIRYTQAFDSFIREPDLRRIGPRLNDNVILHLPVVAVELQINAGIDLLIDHGLVSGYTGLPILRIIADKIVNLSFLQSFRNDLGMFIGAQGYQLDEGLFMIGGVLFICPLKLWTSLFRTRTIGKTKIDSVLGEVGGMAVSFLIRSFIL